MHGGAIGEVFGQISAQQVNDKRGRFVRRKQGDLRPLTHGHQRLGRLLAIGQHQHRGFQGDDACNATRAIFGRSLAHVIGFALAHHLHAVGMDVVEVAHQVCT